MWTSVTLPSGVEAQELGLGQLLLRQGACPAGREESRGRGNQLDKFAP